MIPLYTKHAILSPQQSWFPRSFWMRIRSSLENVNEGGTLVLGLTAQRYQPWRADVAQVVSWVEACDTERNTRRLSAVNPNHPQIKYAAGREHRDDGVIKFKHVWIPLQGRNKET